MTLSLDEPEAWSVRARCGSGDAELFFPPACVERKREKDERESAALALCRSCPIRRDCLEQSVDETLGIWGGLNELQRSRRRRAARQRAHDVAPSRA